MFTKIVSSLIKKENLLLFFLTLSQNLLKKSGAAPIPIFHPKYEELVNFPQLYRRMFLNERAQALAIVKVVCPKKLVKEFKKKGNLRENIA